MSNATKYARVEHERRFLLAAVPRGVDETSGRLIEDRYLEGTRLRLRRIESRGGSVEHKLTLKIECGNARRLVTTLYLTRAEHEQLARLPALCLTKRRSRFAWSSVLFGIDVFAPPLSGLVLAEAEARDEEDRLDFLLPPFAHCEVTSREEFTGAALARDPPSETLALAQSLLDRPCA